MRKNKLYIVSLIVLLCGFITIMLPSCTKSKSNNAAAAGNQFGNGQRPNMANMKSQMGKSLKELVSAGTITQKQSDKILAALTSRSGNRGNFSKNRQASNNSSDKKQSSGNAQGNNKGARGAWNRGSGNRAPGNSALSQLVKDKVITQKQADAVEKKIFSNFRGGQGAPGQNDGNGNNDNSSDQQS